MRAVLFLRRFSGEAEIVQGYRTERRGRAVTPDFIDWIGLQRDQRSTDAGARLGKPLGAFDGMQPRIVTEPVALVEIGLDPLMRRILHEVLDRHQAGIHLLARLQSVATVHEQYRALHEHDGNTGGAAETRQPGQSLLTSGDVFVLLPIGARYDESGEAAPRQLRA